MKSKLGSSRGTLREAAEELVMASTRRETVPSGFFPVMYFFGNEPNLAYCAIEL